jgi:hypothetical protein
MIPTVVDMIPALTSRLNPPFDPETPPLIPIDREYVCPGVYVDGKL